MPVSAHDWTNQALVAVGPVAVSPPELLAALKRRRQLRPLLLEVLTDKLIRAALPTSQLGAQELQQAANRFRQQHGLTTQAQMQQWLTAQGLTLLDFEDQLETTLLRQRFQDHLFQTQGADHFAKKREHYRRARLRHLVVAAEPTARELLSQLKTEDRDFADLARSHSTDATRAQGGDLGIVSSWQLAPVVAQAVFAAKPGAVVGPLATSAGYVLVLVEELLPALLDEATTAHLRQELFAAWLQEQLRDVRFQWTELENAT